MPDASPRHRSTLADHPDLRELLPQFVTRLSGYIQQLRGHLAQGDTGAIQRLVHQLRGTGRTYGFPPISDQAGAIEKMLINGRSLSDIQTALGGLIHYIEHIEGYEPAPDIPPEI